MEQTERPEWAKGEEFEGWSGNSTPRATYIERCLSQRDGTNVAIGEDGCLWFINETRETVDLSFNSMDDAFEVANLIASKLGGWK